MCYRRAWWLPSLFLAIAPSAGCTNLRLLLAQDADAVGLSRPPNPELCRFVLTTPNQYSASKALHRWTEISGGNYVDGEVLKREADKEKLSNRVVRRSNRGKPAIFGAAFQFEHSGGDFLDLKKQIAVEDPAALRAGLADPDNRTKHTWFRIVPGFRTRKEGEPIRFGDTVTIQSLKKSSQLFLHVGRDRAQATQMGTKFTEEERRVNGHEDTFAPTTEVRVELNLCPNNGGTPSASCYPLSWHGCLSLCCCCAVSQAGY